MEQGSTANIGLKETKLRNFYPSVGSLPDYLQNTSAILSKIGSESLSKQEIISWMEHRFGASPEFCRKLLEALGRVGLIERFGRSYRLGEGGKTFRETGDPDILLTTFRDKVAGFDYILEILAEGRPVQKEELSQRVNEQFLRPIARNQLEHRLNWLRGLGYIEAVAGSMLLTEQGMRAWNEVRTKWATPEERLQISHSDIEDKLQIIGKFFEFETTKRPSINQVLPSYALKLSEGGRQLDCLWVRYVHFAGKIKFPIEVHLSGNLADSLDRLETVSEYVQKAIIITTSDQEKSIVDRLRVKRSRLLDKLVIVNVEEVYKVIEATNVIRSLSDKIFSD